jgi:restriction system protein
MDTLAVPLAMVVLVLLVALALRRSGWTNYSGTSSSRQPDIRFKSIQTSFKLFEFRNVIVPDERGTTEIDVILVGNTGIFVIEQKEYNAWIFGGEDDEKWTARYVNGATYQFQNPLRQNHRHVMALATLLGLAKEKIYSLVVFSKGCELRTPMPSNVLIGDYYNRVRSIEGITLTDAGVSKICEILQDLESRSSEAALNDHIGQLRERFSSTTNCPKCGAPLVERRSSKLTSDGKPFLGCRAYPRCTYTRKIGAA